MSDTVSDRSIISDTESVRSTVLGDRSITLNSVDWSALNHDTVNSTGNSSAGSKKKYYVSKPGGKSNCGRKKLTEVEKLQRKQKRINEKIENIISELTMSDTNSVRSTGQQVNSVGCWVSDVSDRSEYENFIRNTEEEKNKDSIKQFYELKIKKIKEYYNGIINDMLNRDFADNE